MQPTKYQLNLTNAVWVDINTRYTQNNLPDRLPDTEAIIKSSLFNLLNCAPGQRGRTFQPEYGSGWLQFIHEPISSTTAAKMELMMIEAIRRWEPRILLDRAGTYVQENSSLPGYVVHISFSVPGLTGPAQLQFEVLQ